MYNNNNYNYNYNNYNDMDNFEYIGYSNQNPSYSEVVNDNKRKAKKKRAKKIIAGVLCCAIVGGTAFAISGYNSSSNKSTEIKTSSRTTSSVSYTSVDSGKEMTASEVYAANVNSTVGITTEVTTNYFGFQSTSAASGSGVIISSDGYIVTNYHVIESASTIKVTMYDDSSYTAELVGYDESNDIAVLKIDATDLTAVTIGNSSAVSVGDDVVAIGNPLGELTFTLTKGVISAKDREVTMPNGTTMELIQTDCAINSGNSGGALFNVYGELIGITNAKYSSSSSSEASIDNIGFAIPISSVIDVIQNIIETGYTSSSDSSSQNQQNYSYAMPNNGYGSFADRNSRYYYG